MRTGGRLDRALACCFYDHAHALNQSFNLYLLKARPGPYNEYRLLASLA